jgi:hypothetical protein
MSSQAQKAPVGEHAVVLGGSMAGLLAARVLADFYRTVTVVGGFRFATDETSQRHPQLRRGSHCR